MDMQKSKQIGVMPTTSAQEWHVEDMSYPIPIGQCAGLVQGGSFKEDKNERWSSAVGEGSRV